MKQLRDLYPYPEKRQLIFILISCIALLTASITSGVVFLWLNKSSLSLISKIILSEAVGLLLVLIPITIMVSRHSRPRENLKKGIKNIGRGRFDTPFDLTKEKMYYDIAASLNEAGLMLNNKMKIILTHTSHLSAIEEELSSSIRTRQQTDSHTKALICQLKICTSRIRNDLSEFSLENTRPLIPNEKKKESVQSSISV